MTSGILFDFNGVIIDDEPQHCDALIDEAVAQKHAAYEQAIRGTLRLVPGAAEFVENAALDGFQLAIVSGALRREIEMVLELVGLRPHFAHIIAAEDVP